MPPVLRYLRSALLAAWFALLLCASPAAASDLLDLNATQRADRGARLDGARHVSRERRDAPRARVGCDQRADARLGQAAGSLQARLLGRSEDAAPRGVGQLRQRLPAVRRAEARLLRCRLQGARRLVLGAPALAAQPAAPRLEAVDVVAARVGAPPLALGRAARAGRPLHGLGVQRRRARHLRTHVIRGQAGARLPHDVERRADRHVRAQSLHRHARLGVRAGLGTGDVDRLPQAHGLVLLLVLADARRVAARAARNGPPGTATATGSASSGRA